MKKLGIPVVNKKELNQVSIPHAAKKAAQLFVNKQPAITKNSPIKLLVPGKPMFAIVKIVKKVEKSGIVVNKPE
jgi:hypothetical protein